MTLPSKVKYVQLGSSGLRISNPILGAMSFGDTRWLPWCIESAAALPLLKSAFDHGINTWDTANNYSNGASEELIAAAIKTYGIPRNKLVIMTKCFNYVESAWVYVLCSVVCVLTQRRRGYWGEARTR